MGFDALVEPDGFSASPLPRGRTDMGHAPVLTGRGWGGPCPPHRGAGTSGVRRAVWSWPTSRAPRRPSAIHTLRRFPKPPSFRVAVESAPLVGGGGVRGNVVLRRPRSPRSVSPTSPCPASSPVLRRKCSLSRYRCSVLDHLRRGGPQPLASSSTICRKVAFALVLPLRKPHANVVGAVKVSGKPSGLEHLHPPVYWFAS